MPRLKVHCEYAGDSSGASAARRYTRHRRVGVALCFCLSLWGALLPRAGSLGSTRAATNDIAATADRDADRARRRFEPYLARVQPMLERYGYGVVALAVMAEGVGIPTPGQTLLMVGALEAAKGRLNIVWLLFLVTGAATVGNSMGYAIGRWGGRAVLKKLKVDATRQQRFDDIFKRYGGVVILLARFVDGLRQLNGIIAGIMRMPWWRFTIDNAAGALVWTCAWGLGTFYLGQDIHAIAAAFHRHRWWLYALSAAAVIFLLAALLRSRSAHQGSVIHR